MNRIPKFKHEYDLSNKDVAAIVCVHTSTIRKYLAHDGAKMKRSVDPSVNAVIQYITEKRLDIKNPVVRKFVKFSPAMFQIERGERSVPFLANLLGQDKSTIYRWESGEYQPSAPASKFLLLNNKFGWCSGNQTTKNPPAN